MRWRLLLGAALTSFCLPAIASACTPPFNSLSGTSPEAGATYPGNAAVVFEGWSLRFEEVSVTVDGVEATLITPELPIKMLDYSQVIEPVPAPGQAVHIQGSLCTNGCNVDLAYTASEHDTTAPAAATQVQLSLHDYLDTETGYCGPSYGHTYWLDVSFPEAESLRYLYAELYRPDDPGSILRDVTVLAEDASHTVDIPISSFDDPTNICVRVTAFDRANNLSDSLETCGLCLLRTDDATIYDSKPPGPDWHAGDLVADGTCPNMVLPPAPETPGCGCHTGSPAHANWSLALIFLASLRARRRVKCLRG